MASLSSPWTPLVIARGNSVSGLTGKTGCFACYSPGATSILTFPTGRETRTSPDRDNRECFLAASAQGQKRYNHLGMKGDAMREAVIISAVRTAIGKFQGALAPLSAVDLGACVVREAVRRAGIEPGQVDEIIMGNVVSAGLGQNPARQAGLKGGLDNRVAAMTINKVCGSGLKAVALAAQAIQTGNSEIVVAGGMESMSNAPYLLPEFRQGRRLGDAQVIDSMIHDGLWDAYENFHMGMTAELVAEKYKISRERQDAYAVESHRRAIEAIQNCYFKEQITPVTIPQKKGEPEVFSVDESPRKDTSLEALSRLKPVFKPDGTVTAGNAPGTNDGAAALVVTSLGKAQQM